MSPTGLTTASTAVAGFVPVAPVRVLDTRFGLGAPVGAVGPDASIDLTVAGVGGVPGSGVPAVALNVTAVLATHPTFITVWPTGESRPWASSINLSAAQVRPNLVVAKVGSLGRVSMYSGGGSVQLVADVVGWFPVGGTYQPVNPTRLLDTRIGLGAPAAAVPAGGHVDVVVAGMGTLPASGVAAVAVNVTATNPTDATYITAYPSGEAVPLACTLNLPAADTRANLAIVKVGAGGAISLFNAAGSVDVIVDVVGWFAAGGAYTPLTPARVLDTRVPIGVASAGPMPGFFHFGFQVTGRGGVPTSGVGAVVLNVTATDPSADTFLTAYPGSLWRPCTSSLNVPPGLTAANLVVVAVDQVTGYVQLYNARGNTHLIADVVGWFPADTTPPTGGSWCGDPFRLLVRADGQSLFGPVRGANAGTGLNAFVVATDDPQITGTLPSSTQILLVENTNPTRRTIVSVDDGSGLLAGKQFFRDPVLSGNGRYVVFFWGGTIYRRDLQTGHIDVVNVALSGAPDRNATASAAISADGRVVAFRSSGGSDLVPGGSPYGPAVYVRDMDTGTTRRVSPASNPYLSCPSGCIGTYLTPPGLSADGAVVAFSTMAALLPDDTNNALDTYVVNLVTNETTRISLGANGVEGTGPSWGSSVPDVAPSVSSDGRAVAFISTLSGLPGSSPDGEAFLWRAGQPLVRVPRGRDGSTQEVVLASANPSVVAMLVQLPKPFSANDSAITVVDLASGQSANASADVPGMTCNYSYLSVSATGLAVTCARTCHPSAGLPVTDVVRWYG